MALRFSPTGVAVYGTGTVAVDGSTPAALAGRTVGPAAWETTGVLVYQDGGTGAGPWTLKRLTLPATIANIDSVNASPIAGGGGQWAAQGSTGLRTDIPIGPFATGLIGDVSADGELLAIDNIYSRSGLTVYDSSGGVLYADPTVVLQSTQVCIRDSFLSYYDATGWHLRDLANDRTPDWLPRTDGVRELVPLTHRGTLYVLEKSNVISLRQADTSQGWILSSDPNAFSLDGFSLNSNIVMAGTCNVPSEAPSSLVVFRCTVTKAKTISVQTGTIVLGAIVYGSAQTVGTSPFTTGNKEGDSLTPPNPDLPNHPLVENIPGRGLMITQPWRHKFQNDGVNAGASSAVLQKLPTPSLIAGGFDKVAANGQPTMQAMPGQTTLTLASADGSVVFTLNPASQTADFSVDFTATGYWSELTNGDLVTPELIFADGDTIDMWVPL